MTSQPSATHAVSPREPEGSIIIGTQYNDSLLGNNGSDTLLGGNGNDTLTGGSGDDLLIGASGDDNLSGDAGDDVLTGGDGQDRLLGGDGDDVLSGGAGNDILDGGAGDNTILAGEGDDKILARGRNTIIGGDGSDSYNVNDFAEAVDHPDVFRDFQAGYGGDVLDLSVAISWVDPANETEYPWLQEPLHPFTSGLLRVTVDGPDTVVQVNLEWIGRGAGYATLVRLENVAPEDLNAFNFSPAYDPSGRVSVAVGTDAADTMDGSLGDDDLSGLGGDDVIRGGEGRDVIRGGDGDDTLHGGEHADTILGGAGHDHIYGDPKFYGGDHSSGHAKPGGGDYIDGGDGDDHFYDWRADGGPNTIIGGAGDDTFHYVSGTEDWSGYEDYPVEAVDILTGGEGRDTYILSTPGTSPADRVTDFKGGPDGDIIDVSELLVKLGDYVRGTSPFLTGHLALEQDGPDVVLKVPGIPYYGAEPTLVPLLTLKNIRISDLTHHNFVPPYDPTGAFGAMRGTEDADILDGSSMPELIAGLGGDDTLRGHAGDDRLEGGEGNDRVEGGPGSDLVYGDAGDDQVSGGAGDDTVSGGDGNDRIQGDNGNDWLYGGNGDDLIMEVEGHHATGPNNDWLWGDAGNDTLQAGAGNDYLDGGQGDDVLRGGTGDDRFSDTDGANLIDGGAGNDLVYYVSYNVTYYGGLPGVDQIYGGSGEDRFVLNFDPRQPMIVDHVMDFETGSGGDVIDFTDIFYRLPTSASGTDLFDAGYFRLVSSGNDTLLEANLLGNGFATVLVMEGTAPEAFTAANFDMVQ